jgi:hypothetical protein
MYPLAQSLMSMPAVKKRSNFVIRIELWPLWPWKLGQIKKLVLNHVSLLDLAITIWTFVQEFQRILCLQYGSHDILDVGRP